MQNPHASRVARNHHRGASMKRSLPWRTIAPSRDTGRFTPEQLDAAVRAVMEPARARRTTGGAMILREQRAEFGAPRPPEDAGTGPDAASPPDGREAATKRSGDER